MRVGSVSGNSVGSIGSAYQLSEGNSVEYLHTGYDSDRGDVIIGLRYSTRYYFQYAQLASTGTVVTLTSRIQVDPDATVENMKLAYHKISKKIIFSYQRDNVAYLRLGSIFMIITHILEIL